MDNSANPLPRFNRCCFFFGLRSGVLIFVSVEALFWAVLSFAAIYCEVKYITNIDLLTFSDDLENDWYYYMIFDTNRYYRDYYFDEKLRTYIVVLNLLLCLIFVSYCIVTLLLLTGISKRSKCLFLPYLIFDIIFLIITLILGIIGSFFRLQIAKVCIFFFFIKFYFAVCVYSLFKNYNGKVSDRISINSTTPCAHESPAHESEHQSEIGQAPLAVAV